ncbi:hypothetical protein HZH66_013505 [Vespula vulgaris]|uniref:Uncharacterized protein n=1 Tax=Vespula vulgaris TaxID=7454 RepID=A0A834J5S7_VESVU|nr:hypothetical protein HZH66_013505 [Vespula vulgaris]
MRMKQLQQPVERPAANSQRPAARRHQQTAISKQPSASTHQQAAGRGLQSEFLINKNEANFSNFPLPYECAESLSESSAYPRLEDHHPSTYFNLLGAATIRRREYEVAAAIVVARRYSRCAVQ